jgi:hypothetical protein
MERTRKTRQGSASRSSRSTARAAAKLRLSFLVAGVATLAPSAVRGNDDFEVIGYIDLAYLDGSNNESLYGWACVKDLAQSINVDLYYGGKAGDGGTFVARYLANQPSEAAVSTACADSGVGHRFVIPITPDLRHLAPGRRLYVHGINPLGNPNLPVISDGGAHIYSMNVFPVSAPTNATTDATPIISAAAWQAATGTANGSLSDAEVLLGAGVYYLDCKGTYAAGDPNGATCFDGSHARNLILGGAGAGNTQLIIRNPRAGMFFAQNASNLAFLGFSIDYAPAALPFTQGRITAVDPVAKTIQVLVDPGMPTDYTPGMPPSSSRFSHVPGSCGGIGMIFDPILPRIKAWSPSANDTVATGISGNTVTLYDNWQGLGTAAVGDRFVQTAKCSWVGDFYVSQSSNVLLDGITMYASQGLTTAWVQNSGVIFLNDVTIEPGPPVPNPTGGPPTVRLLSSDVDGAHFQQNWAQPIIKNCHFNGMADDALNVYSIGDFIVGVLSPTVVDATFNGPVQVNDTIQVMSSGGVVRGTAKVLSVASQPYGQLTLDTAITGIVPGDLLLDGSAAADTVVTVVSPTTVDVTGSTLVHVNDPITIQSSGGIPRGTAKVLAAAQPSRLTFDTAIPGMVAGALPPSGAFGAANGDVLFDVSAAGPGARVQNNVFGWMRGGTKMHSPGAQVLGNTFVASGPALRIMADLYFYEGPMPLATTVNGLPVGISVSGNTFTGGQPYGPPDYSGEFGQISLYDPLQPPYDIGFTNGTGPSNVSIVGNVFNPTDAPNYPIAIFQHDTSNITMSGNTFPAGVACPGDGDPSAVCAATDPPSLLACAAKLQAGTATILEIQGTVTCTGAGACAVAIVNPRPCAITIRGQAGAVLRRIDHYDYPLLSVHGASSLTLSDLVIDELESAPCDPISPTNPPADNSSCSRSIDVYGAGTVTLQRSSVLHSKAQSATLFSCHNVVVTGSRFVDAHLFGLQIAGVDQTMILEGNLFDRIASNALVLSSIHGTAAAPNVVKGNLFEHNHRENLYYMCGPLSNQPCPGGQMYLANDIQWLQIQGNVIRDGSSDTNPTTCNTTGIEVNTAIQNVAITGNDIHACNQSAVSADSATADADGGDVQNVTITNNKFYGNGTFYWGADVLNFPASAVSGTCSTPSCLTVAVGAMWPIPGNGVGWQSNDLASPSVGAGGGTLSTQPNGTAAVAAGTTAVLYDGTTVVDQQLAR